MYRFLGVLILCLCLPLHATQAKNFEIGSSGAWTVTAFYSDRTDKFDFCTISGTYKSGVTVFFALYPDANWSIIFARREGFGDTRNNHFNLYVDDRFVYGGEATRNTSVLVLPLPRSSEVLKAMYGGKTLKVVSAHGTSFFSLNGTAQAITQLAKCVTERNQMADTGRSDRRGDTAGAFGTGEDTPQDSRQPDIAQHKFGREELLKFVSGFLSEAGLDNYRILPYDDTKNFGDVAWQFEDGLIGSIIAFRNAPKLSLNEVGSLALKADAESCIGEFASAKKAPRYFQGMEIFEVATVCRAGEKSFNIQYSVARMPTGTVIRLMSARVGQIAETQAPDSQRVERSQKALLSASPLR
jgi:hypothetical protein